VYINTHNQIYTFSSYGDQTLLFPQAQKVKTHDIYTCVYIYIYISG